MFIFAMGTTNVFLALQLYAIDGFKFPASAFAASRSHLAIQLLCFNPDHLEIVQFLRCVFAGAFPLFGPKLFEKLGIDWGVALLAFLVLGIGLPCIAVVSGFGCLCLVVSANLLPSSSFLGLGFERLVSDRLRILKISRHGKSTRRSLSCLPNSH